MENSNLQKNKKIKLLLEENINLSDQLESSSMATLVRSRNEPVIDLDETLKAQSAVEVESGSVSSSHHQKSKSYVSYVDSERHFQSEADRSFMAEKMEEAERLHRD